MAIRDTSAREVPVGTAEPGRGRRRLLVAGGIAAVALALAFGIAARFTGSRSVDADRIRIAQVTRGTLVRDASVNGQAHRQEKMPPSSTSRAVYGRMEMGFPARRGEIPRTEHRGRRGEAGAARAPPRRPGAGERALTCGPGVDGTRHGSASKNLRRSLGASRIAATV